MMSPALQGLGLGSPEQGKQASLVVGSKGEKVHHIHMKAL